MTLQDQHVKIWTLVAPLVAWLLLALNRVVPMDGGLTLVLLAALVAAALAAVHHAEVLALRLGEPYGTIVLAVCVTVIEVALILVLMSANAHESTALARDAVFAAIMIILNGIVGGCLLLGGARHHEQSFGLQGVTASLATLAAIAVLTLVLPNYTVTVPGPFYSGAQLGFIAVASLALYGTFLLVQTVRHRDYFLPPAAAADDLLHALPPTMRVSVASGVLLMLCLVVVVIMAETVAPAVEHAILAVGAPASAVGIFIAALVLLPEGVAALRAAASNRLQTSLNLAIGSALASIGLTIPTIAIVAVLTHHPLLVGLDGKETVLLVLSLFAASLSLGTGRTTVLEGAVHLLIFAAYLFTTVVP